MSWGQEGESKKLYWNIWYGPDIIRGPSEEGHDFYVVEDNLGYVGGFGDLPLARAALLGETNGSKGAAAVGVQALLSFFSFSIIYLVLIVFVLFLFFFLKINIVLTVFEGFCRAFLGPYTRIP